MADENNLFVDSINQLVYSKDSEGNLWLTDCPNHEIHGDRPQRKRKLISEKKILIKLEDLLIVLGIFSQEIHQNKEIVKYHLLEIGKVAIALASGEKIKEPISHASRCFGWSYLPDEWGNKIEYAWAKFAETARSEN